MSPRIGLDLSSILQAAAEIADREGFDAVTLAALAQKFQIRTPSLYNHVKGLPGLRKELAIYGLEELHRFFANAIVERTGDEAVHSLGKAYITFVRVHPGLYEATLRAPDPNDPDMQRTSSQIVDLVVRVLQAYGLEGEAALHATRGFRSLFHGFASLEQRGGFGLPLDIDESLRLVIDAFLAGIHTLKQQTSSKRTPK